jgi:hypothetical protein
MVLERGFCSYRLERESHALGGSLEGESVGPTCDSERDIARSGSGSPGTYPRRFLSDETGVRCPKGVKITDLELQAINITADEFMASGTIPYRLINNHFEAVFLRRLPSLNTAYGTSIRPRRSTFARRMSSWNNPA